MNLLSLKKYLPYALCLVAGIVIAILLMRFHPGATPEKGSTQVVEQPRNYTDDSGTVHTEIKVAQGESASNNNPYYQHKIDSMAAVLKTKNKYITDLEQLKTESSGTFIPVYIDTAGNQFKINPRGKDSLPFIPINTRVQFKDKFLNLNGRLNDDSSWKYVISEELNIVTHEKKVGWFKRETTVDISSTNTNTRIVGLSAITIKPKPKKWGIGISVGYVYTGKQYQPAVGIGIQRNIIRF